jgi:inosine-uridine nucleoside N-ribohydrolase
MAEALAEDSFHLLALGPMTNVAALMTRHRELQSRIQSMVISAGQRPLRTLQPNPERDIHFADLNVAMDPDAARLVLEARPELCLFPWEAAAPFAFVAGDSAHAVWSAPWRAATGRDALVPWDALAVLWLAQPAWFDAADVSVALQRAPHDGAATAGPVMKDGRREYMTVDFKSESGRYARYATRTKQEAAAWLAVLLRDSGWEHDD